MADAQDRPAQMFPRLSPAQIDALLARGTIRERAAGELLFDVGSDDHPFIVVLGGRLEIVQPSLAGGEQRVAVHEPGEFVGEADMISGQHSVVGARMLDVGELLEIPRADFRELLGSDAELSELVMRAFILRRVRLLEQDQADVVVVGSTHSADTLRLRQFLARNGHPQRFIDIERDPEAQALLEHFGVGVDAIPLVVVLGRELLRNPSNRELADLLGISGEVGDEVCDVLVVGAGPAGLATAVYAASEGLDVVVLESEAPGGQAGTSSWIENYLGFPTGISGQDLSGRALLQAQKFGARFLTPRKAVALRGEQRPYRVELADGERVWTRTIVLATGARYRRLAIPNLADFEGRGVYYGATHVEARLCEDEPVTVVGGGNSGGQAAVYLAQRSREVHLLMREASPAELMSRYLIARIEANERIHVHPQTAVVSLEGRAEEPGAGLERQVWRDAAGNESTHAIRHLFVLIGAEPNTGWLAGSVALDDDGFVLTGDATAEAGGWPRGRRPHVLETTMPGVFAVGDVRAGSVKRVASAVGEGAMCVSFIHRVLAEG